MPRFKAQIKITSIDTPSDSMICSRTIVASCLYAAYEPLYTTLHDGYESAFENSDEPSSDSDLSHA